MELQFHGLIGETVMGGFSQRMMLLYLHTFHTMLPSPDLHPVPGCG